MKYGLCLSMLAALATQGATPAHAFRLGDHKRITLQAIAEFERCYPGLISDTNTVMLWTSDLDEDTDLIRKWILYSHFFNPDKHLEMRRQDSLARIKALQKAIENSQEHHAARAGLGNFAHLGHAVHHIQDMASPPHVVPVMHDLSDGFESFAFEGDIASGLRCADMIQSSSLEDILIETARATLGFVGSERVDVRASSGGVEPLTISVDGDGFWRKSSDDTFGQYGVLGNHYGHASFSEMGVDYAVPPDFYSRFKQRQMKLGVRSTVKALFWLLLGDATAP